MLIAPKFIPGNEVFFVSYDKIKKDTVGWVHYGSSGNSPNRIMYSLFSKHEWKEESELFSTKEECAEAYKQKLLTD